MSPPRLVVVGGGVAGLAAARLAARAGARVTLLEAEDRLGGKILTEMVDGVPWEWGPDALVATKPRGRDLLEELGLLDEAVSPGTGRAYLLLGGELRPLPPGLAMGIPSGPRALLYAVRAGILTPREALRAGIEPLLPRVGRRESVEQVARARLGWGVGYKLVMPLVEGVYGSSDVDWRAALPDLAEARSLMLAARSRPRVRFLGLRGGMVRLVERLADDLGDADVRTGVHARSLEDLCGAYTVRTDHGPVDGDAVLLAVPSPSAVNLLRSLSPETPTPLTRYTRSTVVHLRYPRGALDRPLDAAGYVAAFREPGCVRACSWVTAKWPHLEEPGLHLRAVFAGGYTRAVPRAEADRWVAERTVREIGAVMRASRDPDDVRVHRWTHALPEYRPGHGARVAAFRRKLPQGIAVAGASYDGVGIPDCVASGETQARHVLAALTG